MGGLVRKFLFLLCGLLLLFVIPALGQEDPSVITEEQMLEIASRMYCPICENEPLDECRNATCLQWKDEIRRLLREGYTEEEIISSFVDRYGQHVVGIPRDPTLRTLSFIAPVIGTLLAFVVAGYIFWQWQSQQQRKPKVEPEDTSQQSNVSDEYRALIERDLQ